MSDRRRALIVDDDAYIAEVLETMLDVRGFEVDVAADGIDAIEPRRDYDVILLDLKMPVFDGARLVDYWLVTRPEVLKRVIILSGYSPSHDAPAFPTFATVVKPFEIEQLMEVIAACAEQETSR